MKPIDELAQVVDANGYQVGFLIVPATRKKTDLVEYVTAAQFWQLVREDKVKYLMWDQSAGCFKAHYTDEEIKSLKKTRNAAKLLNLSEHSFEEYFRDDPSFNADDIIAGKNSFTPVLCKLVAGRLLMCSGFLYLNQPMTDDTIKILNKTGKIKLGAGCTIIVKRVLANLLLVTVTLTSNELHCSYGTKFKNVLWFLNGNFGYNMNYLRFSKNIANKAIKLGNDATGAGLPYLDLLDRYLEKCKTVGIGF